MHTTSESSSPQSTKRQTLPARRSWFGQLFADIMFVARRDKKWWLLPLLIVLLSLGGLLVFATLTGPLAPFIYPLL